MSKKNKVYVYEYDLENTSELKKLHSEIKYIIENTFRQEKNTATFEISVILTSNKYITQLNRDYLKRNFPTDVLCFPYSTGKHFAADIFISVEKAKEQARTFRSTLKREILFLTLHALLHLFGWKDNTEKNRKKMLAYQEKLLKCISL